MKVWITAYALTKGIFEVDVEMSGVSDDMVVDRSGGHAQYYHGNDWHQSLAEARKYAELMRLKRIAILKKSITKLEKLTF